jgi:hypothetical protein
MGLFRRSEPLHERLAREGGLIEPAPTATRPEWQETGIHGIARPREWDATVTADAPDVSGDAARFVVLPDGTVLVEEGTDESLDPLATAVEQVLHAPYRARAARQSGELWAVQAKRIEILEIPNGPQGNAIELTRTADGTTLAVDDSRSVGRIAVLERRGEQEGPEYVVRAERIEGDLWEIHAGPL